MQTKTEVSPLVGAGTETSGDTLSVPPTSINSPVLEGETPFVVVPTAQAAVRIGPINYGFLSVVMDLEGGVRVHLSGVPQAGGEYVIRIFGNKADGLVVEHGVTP